MSLLSAEATPGARQPWPPPGWAVPPSFSRSTPTPSPLPSSPGRLRPCALQLDVAASRADGIPIGVVVSREPGYLDYLAKYLKGTGIRVNAISPGGILDSQPSEFLDRYKENCLSKGMLDVNDLNGTLLYLLSDMAAYVNGQNLIVDDGFSL